MELLKMQQRPSARLFACQSESEYLELCRYPGRAPGDIPFLAAGVRQPIAPLASASVEILSYGDFRSLAADARSGLAKYAQHNRSSNFGRQALPSHMDVASPGTVLTSRGAAAAPALVLAKALGRRHESVEALYLLSRANELL